MEILAAEHCTPPAIALVFHAATLVIALGTHLQTLAGDGGKIDHRRKGINRHAVRTVVRSADALAPRGKRPAGRAVDAEAAVLCSCEIFHQNFATIEAVPLWAM